MCAGKDKNCLIWIRQQNLLIVTLWPWIRPDQSLLPFFNFFDHSGAVRQNCDPHAIADGGQIAGSFALFQSSA